MHGRYNMDQKNIKLGENGSEKGNYQNEWKEQK